MVLPTHIVAAAGLVVNEQGEILLVKNPRKGWEFPGGIVEPGETLLQGLQREIREESGVEAEAFRVVGLYSNVRKQKGYNGVKEIPTILNVDFLCRYRSGELKTSEESEDVRWFSRADAPAAVRPGLRYRFSEALRVLESGGDFLCAGFSVGPDGMPEVREERRLRR